MIVVEGLTKSYRRREVLKGVTFTLEPGVTGVLGPNGAGKTTLLRCMLGIVRPDAGVVAARDGGGFSLSDVGYLPQKYGLLRELTAEESLAYYAVLKRIPRKQVPEEIDRCLTQVNLLEVRSKRVGALSGGMVRRLGIAAALLGDPTTFFFDEPTAGLDPEERVRFKQLIAGISGERAVLISTHIIEDLQAVASRVMVLNEGLLMASGTLADIAHRAQGKVYLAPERALGTGADVSYVVRFIDSDHGRQARVLAARPQPGFAEVEPTVEDGYLCITRGIA